MHTKLSLRSPIALIMILSLLGGLAMTHVPWMSMYGMYPGFHGGITLVQFVTYSFLHGGFGHMLSNVLFFLIIGRVVEETHGAKYVTLLWIVTTIFVGLILIFLSDGITIGGSGFAMSLLSVYTYDFYRRRDPQYRAGILLIVINIVMGLSGNISLLGHAAGAFIGWMFCLCVGNRIKKR